MEANFKCPHCNAYLDVNNNIVLKIKNQNEQYGMILLSSKVGEYVSNVNSNFKLVEGENYSFFCPICDKKLSENNNKMASIIMEDENKDLHWIVFSEIFGKHCTYKIKDKQVETFGKDYHEFVDFVTLSYLK